MRHRCSWSAVVIACGALVAFATPLEAQTGAKQPVPYSAYDSWKSIRGTTLSHDGAWLVYALVAEEGDGEIVARNLRSGAEFRQPRGIDPVVTPDGAFVVFTIVPARADVEKAKKAKAKPEDQPKNGLGILSLADGHATTVDGIASFKIPVESSTWVAMLKAPLKKSQAPGRGDASRASTTSGQAASSGSEQASEETASKDKKKKDPGTDLIVRNLATGTETTIAEVSDYAWNRDGSELAYAVSSAKAQEDDGAFLRDTTSGQVHTLLKGAGHYRDLTFDKAGHQLAFLSDESDYTKDAPAYALYYGKTGDSAVNEVVDGATAGVPKGMVVSEHSAPVFSKDGARLFLGVAPPMPVVSKNAPPATQVDLWSYTDEELQPMQKVRAEEEKNRSYAGVVQLTEHNRYVQLGALDLPSVAPTDDPSRAFSLSDLKYAQEISWDATYNDAYLVDLDTGARHQVLTHWPGRPSLSPGGNYVLYFDEHSAHWYTYRVKDGARHDLTNGLTVAFADERHDTPNPAPAYGSAGWTRDDGSVLLYDRYDIWEVRPDGSGAHMITGGLGRKAHLEFRYRGLDPDEKTVPSSTLILLHAVDDDTKASGYYRVTIAAAGAPQKLLMADKSIGYPTKAKNADVMVVTESDFEEFPDLWVTNSSLAAPRKVTAANPQQAQYTWGTSELIHYTNADGVKLDAILMKPDNFDPSKKYPLIVYIYERLTDGLHAYHEPAPGTSINVARYVSHGYVVLEPDIVYKDGYPGPSALKCVVPAVQTVEAMGFIDPARVGIQGHSWGGYEIGYMVTQTNIFRAVEAGAVVGDMFSAYGGMRWGTGMVREFQYEKTQSRIGATPWDEPQLYLLNSPLFFVKNVQTPYLTIANDGDDAVPWYQGIEFFTALRRLGKPAWMFVFNGEKHGLRQRDNQKYWTVHLDEYFDHYLLGAAEPEWMKQGVPYLHKGERDIAPLFEPAEAAAPAANPRGGGRRMP
jgi:dipeptidyl aminopeptidase/acylaminoacyl peptidase